MWRALKINGMYKGGRFITQKDIEKKIQSMNDFFDDPVITNTFIPSIRPDGTYDNNLAGLVFIEYEDQYDDQMTKLVFRQLYIGAKNHQIVTEKHIENMKEKLEKSREKIVEVKTIKEGDVLSFSGMPCMVTAVNGDNIEISLNLFESCATKTNVTIDQLSFPDDNQS